MSEMTDESSQNTLILAQVEVVRSRDGLQEQTPQFVSNNAKKSSIVKKIKTIIHPGQVNRIRELPRNSHIVATHTDGPDVLVWDFKEQENRVVSNSATVSVPNLILKGHTEDAEFALATCTTEPFVLSGGKDKSVVFWGLQDHICSSVMGSIYPATTVQPRDVYLGHEKEVEDVQFLPSSAQEFCSVGDDKCLILWDARVGTCPVIKVKWAHNADVHSVDWNRHDENLILTGSADETVHIFDRRMLTTHGVGSPVQKFKGHNASIICVQWCPEIRSVFGSSAVDGCLNIWDFGKVGMKRESSGLIMPNSGLFFEHKGHRGRPVYDFQWNARDPWTVASVSQQSPGGLLEIWRMAGSPYKPAEEILASQRRSIRRLGEALSYLPERF